MCAAESPAYPPVTIPGSELRTIAETHKDLPVRLFLAAGGAEPLMTPGVSFARTIAARNYVGLHWDGRVIEDERHAGVLPEFYNRGLRFLFSPD